MFIPLFVSAASAQGLFDFDPTPVLVGGQDGATWSANGVGSPAVVWDPDIGRYIMFFETNTGTDPNCPVGTWGIGYATSPDGFTWTIQPGPTIEPDPGTYFSCVAAHPTAVYDVQNRAATVWFKAEQGLDACDNGTPTWGCGQYTGIGRARVKFRNGTGAVQNVRIETTPDIVIAQNFGYPKFVEDGGEGFMMLTQFPNAYMATGPKIGSGQYTWTLDTTTPVLTPGVVSWAMTEYFNPALVCEDDPLFPFTSYLGGRSRAGGSIVEAGWGRAVSSDAFTWLLGTTPDETWSGPNDWRHWDVLRTTTGDVMMWYAAKNAGRNEIFIGATDLLFNAADTYDKQCP